jgi:hypothetical protein
MGLGPYHTVRLDEAREVALQVPPATPARARPDRSAQTRAPRPGGGATPRGEDLPPVG